MKTRIGITVGALLLSACSSPSPTPVPVRPDLGAVLFAGDSVAAGESAPLTEAFAAAGVRFRSIASEGGGNVVGPNAEATWETLPAAIAEDRPAVVIYQITTYDWGTEPEQRAAYTRLAESVGDATLVIVTVPPIRADDFYTPHLADLARTATVARDVPGAHLLDASEVWGTEFTPDGRSTDGIHTCPQGAARFTTWLLRALAALWPGFTPPAPDTWANTGWSTDRRFVGC
ncbi:SGNH/GDSL hydrolase family protein [Catenuloplanes japonicus]|uniref:SGNH/GDSL hydrolase family protein n=1 Tax=Catenuloplanes japonicus TaxID=33876 RepID=UPI0012F8985C|nr:SGNH/GDSL hydrolase family protein [Catenuloplanes japonicus]